MSFERKSTAFKKRKRNATGKDWRKILEVSRQAISKWESNTAYPETEKLIALSNLFDVSIDYLIKGR